MYQLQPLMAIGWRLRKRFGSTREAGGNRELGTVNRRHGTGSLGELSIVNCQLTIVAAFSFLACNSHSATLPAKRREAGSGIPVLRSSGIPVSRSSGPPVSRYSGPPVFRYSGPPVSRYSGPPVFRSSSIPVLRSICSRGWTTCLWWPGWPCRLARRCCPGLPGQAPGRYR